MSTLMEKMCLPAIKILSVDDEAPMELLMKQYFRRHIRNGEYEFFFARNGVEALEVMKDTPDIEIVLLDINMPEMDGLTLLAKLNEMHKPALRVIMVSAYGDMANIRQAMNNGAFDFAIKPIDMDDLNTTIKKAIEQINYVHESQKEHSQLMSLKKDLMTARDIQQYILPQVFPPFPEDSDKLDIYASMEAAKDIGGDFYDFFRIDEDHIGFVMADVSGKGVPAAIFMAVSRTLIRAIGMQGNPPEDTITRANDLLCKESVNCMFVTVFYAIYNTKTGEVEYCNAGHNSPYLIHANGQVEALPTSTNCMIGAIEGLDFVSGSLKMEQGDMLVMYTDGVNEAVNNAFEEYGDQRLLETLQQTTGKSCRETIDVLLNSVKAFADGAPQSDDITMLSFKRK